MPKYLFIRSIKTCFMKGCAGYVRKYDEYAKVRLNLVKVHATKYNVTGSVI